MTPDWLLGRFTVRPRPLPRAACRRRAHLEPLRARPCRPAARRPAARGCDNRLAVHGAGSGTVTSWPCSQTRIHAGDAGPCAEWVLEETLASAVECGDTKIRWSQWVLNYPSTRAALQQPGRYGLGAQRRALVVRSPVWPARSFGAARSPPAPGIVRLLHPLRMRGPWSALIAHTEPA